MKKLSVTLLISFISSSAFAVENGTPVDWKNSYDDVVENQCTGLIIAGNKILTAAHCLRTNNIEFSDGSSVNALSRKPHPSYEIQPTGNQYDLAIWTLPSTVNVKNIHFLENVTTQTVKVGDSLRSFGFGGDNPLAYVSYNVTKTANRPNYTWTLITGVSTISGANLIGGDSGGITLNNSDKVVGINSATSGNSASQTDLYYGKDFILETVNGWHYPTLATTSNNKSTITVQSLHKNPTTDAAYTDGGITVVGGTCQGRSNIAAFETCTYEIEGTSEGKLYLSANEFIHINKPASTSKPNNGGSNGGSSGGSLGWLSLAVLALMRLRKQK
ncbi:trypsin-like serine protease [Vibrio tapetis subsp. quintayensis]|uniref:trypsin-like serine protease n=1 Tax=Vibrio tapetis TaxID=52443 RepID=UPI0025B600C3|nr:trypsin-like serine protease [Vibrio tapetis]MDN3683205.1 trypsin-like serine protease [Vibrio tapetis subsp. quintayensis]